MRFRFPQVFFALVSLFSFLIPPDTVASASQELARPVARNAFDLNLQQVFDETGNPYVIVEVAVAYRRLVFFKKGGVYEAKFRVFVELKDRKGKHIFGDVFEKKVVVESYRETTSSKMRAVVKRRLPVEPGIVTVEATIEVLGTSRRFERREKIRVLSGKGRGVAISSPSFKACGPGSPPSRGEMKIVLLRGEDRAASTNFEATYTELNRWPRVEYSIVLSRDLAVDTVVVASKLLDPRGKVILYSRKAVPVGPGGSSRIAVEFDISSLPIGFYTISTSVFDPSFTARERSDGEFTIVFNRALFDKYYQDLIELISYIADEDEIAELSGAVGNERIEVWRRFWEEKDPTPSTGVNEKYDSFIERLVYVMKHFSKIRPGWKTDMGKVYIANGHPDRMVERQSGMLGKYYQYWYYYSRGIVYIFEDAVGNGDYKLLSVRMI